MTTGSARAVTFPGGAGAALSGALDLPVGRPVAYALFAHCFSCSKDIRAAREIARSLRSKGFAVLRFDFTGLGASEGAFPDTNFSSNVDDLVAAADFLRRAQEAPSILIGHSLGAAAAIVAARRIPEIKGVAIINAPAEAAHVATHFGDKRDTIVREGEAKVPLAGRPLTIRKQFLDDLENADVVGAAAALARPLLILHAPRDEVVGVENASRLFLAAKHPKSFVSLDDADHLLADPADARYAAEIIAAWASRYIGAAPGDDAAPVRGGVRDWARDGARAETIDGRRYAVALSIDGHPYIVDADPEDGGDGLGPNPTRMVEAALAACGLITMKMYAERKGWPLDRASIDISRAEGADPHAARELEKTVFIDAALPADARARLVEISDKCPVHRLLSGGVEIRSALSDREG